MKVIGPDGILHLWQTEAELRSMTLGRWMRGIYVAKVDYNELGVPVLVQSMPMPEYRGQFRLLPRSRTALMEALETICPGVKWVHDQTG